MPKAQFDRRAVMTGLLALGAASPGLWPVVAQARPRIGAVAPAFTLYTFDHRRVTLADLSGKVVVLNYWATWCGPCKHEMPLIDAYVRQYNKTHTRHDLMVFAVTVDNTVPDAELQPLADQLSFPLVTRIDGNYGTIDDAVPSNYVIDRSGVLRYARAAAFDYDSFAATVGPLLAAPAPDLSSGQI
ncbi:TlpA disulfide reductase family protein [Asticcacaulis sp. EMRT-3]|uniref:TlpA family protein disulfide reductase n=1 Tax=Asticcacaulis sp. EMRT-3 TaxID=3040349 RepID=UPI0024AEA676|nr:TlpA disulfide reductase family protein [Asticcacaulis sp. EMRT-3]MDI7775662.1 TlpA disulfide reductase family protein [Asticcacaulis sp. EMRT-3]